MSQYIEELLTQHECVIVPGLGGFVLRRESAIFGINRITPPQIIVGFNPNLSYHDGLLAEVVMRRQSLDYIQAINWINERINTFKTSLSAGNSVSLGNLGTLNYISSSEYSFIPGDMSFLPDNLGLDVIHLYPIKVKTPTDDVHFIDVKEKNSVFSNLLDISDTRRFVHYAASIFLVFLLSLLMPSKINHYENLASLSFGIESQSWSLPELLTYASLNQISNLPLVGDANFILNPSSIFSKLLDDNIVNNSNRKECDRISSIDFRYQIIVASLPSQAKAEEFIQSTTAFDSKDLRIIQVKNKFRISTAQFDSRKNADTYIDSLRLNNIKARKAWIYLLN